MKSNTHIKHVVLLDPFMKHKDLLFEAQKSKWYFLKSKLFL